ncbi:MAG: nitronate monooxygenase [Spirochaetia bacterium]|nr:nitronate monooxygenase [Spirochaetia bacterium]
MTKITQLLGIKYPIIGAPMFLVSGPQLVAAVSNAGGIGTFASMSYRTPDHVKAAIDETRKLTNKPFGMNIVLHKAHNPHLREHFQLAIDEKIPLIITSMGTPRSLIKDAHMHDIKVFCDVISLKQAEVVEKAGADGIIAVTQGAGGHAGNINPFSFIPYLKDTIKIPVIAAGAISRGSQMAAAFSLGAEAVYVGTRFIATPEANASNEYKQALINANPEDIIYSDKISGINANWIKESFDRWIKYDTEKTHDIKLKRWIDIWSAGQGVAQIHDIQPVNEIMMEMIGEYNKIKSRLP